MTANDMAHDLAEEYGFKSSDADSDWMLIDAQKRRRLALLVMREQELELDFFASQDGIDALNAMLDLIVYGHAGVNGSKKVLRMLADYTPAFDVFEEAREKLLDDSIIQPSPDFELDDPRRW